MESIVFKTVPWIQLPFDCYNILVPGVALCKLKKKKKKKKYTDRGTHTFQRYISSCTCSDKCDKLFLTEVNCVVETSTVLLLIYTYSCVWATQSSFDTCGATILVPTSSWETEE